MRVSGNSIIVDSIEELMAWMNIPHELRPCCNPESKLQLLEALEQELVSNG